MSKKKRAAAKKKKAAAKKAKAPPPADEPRPEHVQLVQPDVCAGCGGGKSASTCLCADCWERLPAGRRQEITAALHGAGRQSQAYRAAVAAAIAHVARVHARRLK